MDVAVIMPVWGQGALLGESISSVLSQDTDANATILLMDDACPEPQTVAVCRRFARAHPDRISHVRSPVNRGLAAMRNLGAELALARHPDLYAVLSFDGDDRLHPAFLARALAALRQAVAANEGPHRVGWVFEDPDHFGQDGVMLRTRRYSALWSMAGCANCPTSLTLADVYRDGIRFREDMRHGSEDWAFWLACLAHGFRGVYVPHLGFRYRRRPGSMSAGALRLADSNRTDIRLGRRDIFHPDFFLREEAREYPRYLTVTADGAGVVRRHAGDPGTPLTRRAYVRQLAEHARLPTSPLPQFLVFGAQSAFDGLAEARLLPWALWRLEHLARDTSLASLGGTAAAPLLRCVASPRLLGLCRDAAALAAATRHDPGPAAAFAPDSTGAFHAWLDGCRRDHAALDLTRRADMATWKPFGLACTDLARDFFAIPTLLAGDRAGRTALVTDAALLAEPDLRDAVAALATDLAQAGTPPALVVIGPPGPLPDLPACAEVFFAPAQDNPAGQDALAGLLAPFGTLVDAGSSAAVPVLNRVRVYGRTVIGALAADAATPLGRDLITCFKVFDRILARTPQEAARCRAKGAAVEQLTDSLAA